MLLTSYGKNLTILDIEGYEFVCFDISLDEDLIELMCITDVLDGLVIVSGPEEGYITERHHLSKHIESRV